MTILSVCRTVAASLLIGAASVAYTATEATAPAMPGTPGDFELMQRPAPPDYALQSSWAALPTMTDAADLVPAGAKLPDRQATARADVFYIHPTTYRGLGNWNQSLDDATTNKWTDESVIARQAAVFNACCKIYAPRYRQAQSAASSNFAADGGKAYALAYQDIRAAFRHYRQHWSNDRPFILAGHSQGALHVQTLLREFGDDPKFRQQLIAAYVIGIPTLESLRAAETPWLPVCARPTSTHCLLGWNSVKRDSDLAPFVARNQARQQQLTGDGADAISICVNPLTFDLRKPAAPAARNPGTLPGKPSSDPLPATRSSVLGAACEQGYLRTDVPAGDDYATVLLPGGSLHFNEFDFFFDSIRANALRRVERIR